MLRAAATEILLQRAKDLLFPASTAGRAKATPTSPSGSRPTRLRRAIRRELAGQGADARHARQVAKSKEIPLSGRLLGEPKREHRRARNFRAGPLNQNMNNCQFWPANFGEADGAGRLRLDGGRGVWLALPSHEAHGLKVVDNPSPDN
jgi:hypothetical protein